MLYTQGTKLCFTRKLRTYGEWGHFALISTFKDLLEDLGEGLGWSDIRGNGVHWFNKDPHKDRNVARGCVVVPATCWVPKCSFFLQNEDILPECNYLPMVTTLRVVTIGFRSGLRVYWEYWGKELENIVAYYLCMSSQR